MITSRLRGRAGGRFGTRTGGVLFLCAACLAGCSSYGAARLQSNPSGAEVVDLANDNLIATTPQDVSWADHTKGPKMITVRFQKIGYVDKVTSFTVDIAYLSQEKALLNAKPILVELEKK